MVEDADGDLTLADATERRVIEEIRRMGQEALEAWAGREVEKTGAALEQDAAVRRGGKKTLDRSRSPPGWATATVRSRRERAVTDLGADVSFAQTVAKPVEHYGVTLPVETVRQIVEGHGQAMFDEPVLEEAWPTQPGHPLLAAQIDGGMIPIVQSDPAQADRRTGKHPEWKEAKLCPGHPLGSVAPTYGGTLRGGVEEAGRQLFDCARQAGFGNDRLVHAVGDGAAWIAGQIDERFGTQGQFPVDFYHVGEYLAEASHACGTQHQAWLETQKRRLKTNRLDLVLAELAAHQEPEAVANDQAPIRRCHRYLFTRRHQLDYRGALRRGLPIGSGEIESSHRYIAQQRLKRPGAWWTPERVVFQIDFRQVSMTLASRVKAREPTAVRVPWLSKS